MKHPNMHVVSTCTCPLKHFEVQHLNNIYKNVYFLHMNYVYMCEYVGNESGNILTTNVTLSRDNATENTMCILPTKVEVIVMDYTSNSCKTLIGVDEKHGRMHPNQGLATILLAHNLYSSSDYLMIAYTPPIVVNLPIQT